VNHRDRILGSSAVPPGLLVLAAACAIAAGAARAEEWRTTAVPLQIPEPGVPIADLSPEAIVPPEPSGVAPRHGPTPRLLPEFVAFAERSHPRLRSARAAVEAARGKAVQARLYPNPMLAGGSPQIAGDYSQWNGFVTQDIVTAGKLRLSQQAALREVQQAEYELIRARYDVLTGVRSSFYALLVSQRRAEIYKLLFDIAKRSYDIGAELAEAGEVTKADVLFWSIEKDRAEVRLVNASVFIETGRRELAAAIGLPRADVGQIEADLFQTLPNFDLKQLQEAVASRNAKPRAAEAGIARAQWALERAVVEPVPNINVLGGYQRQVDYPPQEQGLVQVMMEVPLFDRNQGTIRSARADIASSRAALREVEIDLAAQTAQVVNIYRQAQRMVDWYEEYILPKARETVQITQQLYARGEVTFLNLLEAQRILTQTELAFVEAQAERWNGAVQIADLLQLEEFPPRADAPAARPDDPHLELRDDARRVGHDPNRTDDHVAPAGGGEPLQQLPPPSDSPIDWIAGPEPLHHCAEPRALPPCVPPPPCHPSQPPAPHDLVGADGAPSCGPIYGGPCQPRANPHGKEPAPWWRRLPDRMFDLFYTAK
jgi:cobalt-zinc-cadmium efflux system outer membrane protein